MRVVLTFTPRLDGQFWPGFGGSVWGGGVQAAIACTALNFIKLSLIIEHKENMEFGIANGGGFETDANLTVAMLFVL